jgi:hypothetical protein
MTARFRRASCIPEARVEARMKGKDPTAYLVRKKEIAEFFRVLNCESSVKII